MGEEASQGITRRDLLRRGAVLGGAVVWTTPVVQTLGMGRAFAQEASPTGGKEISYIAINVTCGSENFWVKWEDGDWEDSPGKAPDCADVSQLNGIDGSGKGFEINPPDATSSCVTLTIPDTYVDCSIEVWVKAGSSKSTPTPCNYYHWNVAGELDSLNVPGDTQICTAT